MYLGPFLTVETIVDLQIFACVDSSLEGCQSKIARFKMMRIKGDSNWLRRNYLLVGYQPEYGFSVGLGQKSAVRVVLIVQKYF